MACKLQQGFTEPLIKAIKWTDGQAETGTGKSDFSTFTWFSAAKPALES